jgi:tripartite-type tricarboxylate transporter receptor subunit TctC
LSFLSLWVGALLFAGDAAAQSPGAPGYPDARRELRHIVPWGAGGATDTAMRGFLHYAEKELGVPIVSENIPGGLGSVGLLRLKAARPDGYTIGTLTYDVLSLEFQGLAPVRFKDFEIVGMVTEHPSALIVAADRWKSLVEFRGALASRPGKMRIGNVGTGGIWHQHAAAMAGALGAKVIHVPYEAGSGAQLAALLGGEVDANVSSLPASLAHIREGRLRVLAVMSGERDELVPDAPTFKELGYDVIYGGFRALVAPRGTPSRILSHLESVFRRAFEDRGFQAWAEKAAIGARWRNSKETRDYLEALAPRVESLMAELGLRP